VLQDYVADTSPTIREGGTEANGQSRSPQAPRDPPQRPESCGHGSSPPTRGGGAYGGHDFRARGRHLRRSILRRRPVGYAPILGRPISDHVPLWRRLCDLLPALAAQVRRAPRQRFRGSRTRPSVQPRTGASLPFRRRGRGSRLSVATGRRVPCGAGHHWGDSSAGV
jgi:hypothetical protein